jgi:hypothetical protein
MSDEKIIKIKRSSKKQVPIPTPQELRDGMSEWLIKNSIDATLHYIRSALSTGQAHIDIPFVINQTSDYDVMENVLARLRSAGHDIEMIQKDVKPCKLPDGKEFTQVLITNRYYVIDRKSLNKEQASEALQSFERIKKVIGETN